MDVCCPFCRTAPITVAKGNERRYLKVDRMDMDKHDVECPYRLEKGNTQEVKTFYEDLDNTDIKNRLISCLNKMLKSVRKVKVINRPKLGNGNEIEESFLNFTTKKNAKKYLPHKNFTVGTLKDDLGIQKIFYGKCLMYMFSYTPNGETEIKMYYLKILERKNKQQIFDIAITPWVHEYLRKELDELPKEKNEAKSYYLCFSGIMEENKYSFKSKLRDSRLIVFEEDMEEMN